MSLRITVTRIPRETFPEAVSFLAEGCLRVVDAGTREHDLIWKRPKPSANGSHFDIWEMHVNNTYTRIRSNLTKADVIAFAQAL